MRERAEKRDSGKQPKQEEKPPLSSTARGNVLPKSSLV